MADGVDSAENEVANEVAVDFAIFGGTTVSFILDRKTAPVFCGISCSCQHCFLYFRTQALPAGPGGPDKAGNHRD